MSEGSRSRADTSVRPIRYGERKIVEKMLAGRGPADLSNLRVVDAKDGGMGGVRFVSLSLSTPIFGSEIARAKYTDSDGVPVSISLNQDRDGHLFELDIWKVNFEKLKCYPAADQIEIVPE